jgi:small GTP-binding protein
MSGELKGLINQLSDANPKRRAQAAYDLGEYACKGFKDESAIPKLVKLLGDKNEEVNENASYTLTVYVKKGLMDRSALHELVELLEDQNEDVCSFAAYTIGSYALWGHTDEAALPKLVKLLEGKREEVCENAASVLAIYAEKGLVSEESVHPLLKLLDNASESVRKAAEWALDSIAKHYHVSRKVLIETARMGDFRRIISKAGTPLPTRDFTFKILMAGDGSVGKTALIKRWIDGKFSIDCPMTIGPSFAVKTLHIEGKPIKLQIWDFGGQPHWSEMRMTCYKGAVGAMYVYDVYRMETYDNIPSWYEEVWRVCGDIPRILIANKVDLKDLRVVNSDMGHMLAEELGNIPYFETSAKTGQQVNEAFQKIAELVYEWDKKKRTDSVFSVPS